MAAAGMERPGSFVGIPGPRSHLGALGGPELVVGWVFLVAVGGANCEVVSIVLLWNGLMPVCVGFWLP